MSGENGLCTDGGRDSHEQNPFKTGYRHDRQILVVGHGLAAATTAGFLEQQGLDPVLAGPVNSPAQSAVIPLWEPGLSLLARLGLRRPIEQVGTPLNRLECRTSGKYWNGSTESRQSLVLIDRTTLRRLLDRHLLDNIRTPEQQVTATESDPLGTTVTFDHNLEESFDAVVTTVPSVVPRSMRTPQPVTANVWECGLENNTAAPAGLTEAWGPKRAVLTVSTDGTTHARFISVADVASVATVDVSDLERRFEHLLDKPDGRFRGLQNGRIQYRQSQRVVPMGPTTPRMALAASAARASFPGDLLGPTLGIEDAWTVADALAFGPSNIATAIEKYETRRRRRQLEITHSVTDLVDERNEREFGPVIRRLRGRRALASLHILDGTLPAVAQSILK